MLLLYFKLQYLCLIFFHVQIYLAMCKESCVCSSKEKIFNCRQQFNTTRRLFLNQTLLRHCIMAVLCHLLHTWSVWFIHRWFTVFVLSSIMIMFIIINIYFLNIFYCLNNNKRIFQVFQLSIIFSIYIQYTIYNIQYDKHYYYIISLKFSHEDMKQKMQQ